MGKLQEIERKDGTKVYFAYFPFYVVDQAGFHKGDRLLFSYRCDRQCIEVKSDDS